LLTSAGRCRPKGCALGPCCVASAGANSRTAIDTGAVGSAAG
jgi:hypothetical protein